MQNTELVSAEPSCFPAENPLPGHPAMVVCPGGAYATLSPFEGEAVARYFASKGFTGYVCNYGVGEQARMPGPLHQLARTVQAAREKADFVAVCGFSAGAHLCALLSTRWKSVAAELAVSGAALRPDAAVLGYPLTDFLMSMPLQPLAMFQAVDGTTGEASVPEYFRGALCQTPQGERLDFRALSLKNLLGTEHPDPAALRFLSPARLVDCDTSPAFVWTTRTDSLIPCGQSVAYADALAAQGVQVALHVFSQGEHGEGLAQANPESHLWPTLAENWLLSVRAHARG